MLKFVKQTVWIQFPAFRIFKDRNSKALAYLVHINYL